MRLIERLKGIGHRADQTLGSEIIPKIKSDDDLYKVAANVVRVCLRPYALDPVVDRLAGKFRDSTTPDEVKDILYPVLQSTKAEWYGNVQVMLNFYGAKTNGFQYGNLVQILESVEFSKVVGNPEKPKDKE